MVFLGHLKLEESLGMPLLKSGMAGLALSMDKSV